MTPVRKNCTIRELAKHLGLSTTTISMALNRKSDRTSIPEATCERVRAAAERLGYVPNVNAQRFFRKKSYVIGLLVPPQEEMGHNVCQDAHFVQIMSGIESVIKNTQYNLLLLYNRPDYYDKQQYAAMFRSGFLDGLLVWGAHCNDASREALLALEQPCIFISTVPDCGEERHIHYVVSDYEQSAFDMACHFQRMGKRNMVFIAGKPEISIHSSMLTGIRRAGVAMPETHIRHCCFSENDGSRIAAEFIAALEPDAILTAGPGLAQGAWSEVRRAGRDIVVGSCDGLGCRPEHADFVRSKTDDVRIGQLAVEKLIALTEGETTPVQIKVPVSHSFDAIQE